MKNCEYVPYFLVTSLSLILYINQIHVEVCNYDDAFNNLTGYGSEDRSSILSTGEEFSPCHHVQNGS